MHAAPMETFLNLYYSFSTRQSSIHKENEGMPCKSPSTLISFLLLHCMLFQLKHLHEDVVVFELCLISH